MYAATPYVTRGNQNAIIKAIGKSGSSSRNVPLTTGWESVRAAKEQKRAALGGGGEHTERRQKNRRQKNRRAPASESGKGKKKHQDGENKSSLDQTGFLHLSNPQSTVSTSSLNRADQRCCHANGKAFISLLAYPGNRPFVTQLFQPLAARSHFGLLTQDTCVCVSFFFYVPHGEEQNTHFIYKVRTF